MQMSGWLFLIWGTDEVPTPGKMSKIWFHQMLVLLWGNFFQHFARHPSFIESRHREGTRCSIRFCNDLDTEWGSKCFQTATVQVILLRSAKFRVRMAEQIPRCHIRNQKKGRQISWPTKVFPGCAVQFGIFGSSWTGPKKLRVSFGRESTNLLKGGLAGLPVEVGNTLLNFDQFSTFNKTTTDSSCWSF